MSTQGLSAHLRRLDVPFQRFDSGAVRHDTHIATTQAFQNNRFDVAVEQIQSSSGDTRVSVETAQMHLAYVSAH